MTTLQTLAALEEFRTRFDTPYWKPENEDSILADWDTVLKNYSEMDVRTACGELCCFGKLKSFPTIGHIAARLKANYTPLSKELPKVDSRFMDDLATRRKQYVENGCNGHYCFACDFDDAVRAVFKETEQSLPINERFKSSGEIAKLALSNGFWDNLPKYLERITANRQLMPLPHANENAEVDVDFDDFSPYRTRRAS